MVTYDENSSFEHQRDIMIRSHLMGRDITDPAVLDAMRNIPRQAFIPPAYSHEAYADKPIPIGMGQTISQPYIVALMTQILQLDKDCSVLEIGTGSGYQTAILAKLAKHVYTIERHHELTESAQTVLASLGIDNVQFVVGDGSKGWPENKTFDRIILTAATPNIPQPIKNQLEDQGLVIAPVGGPFCQDLTVFKKNKDKLQPSMVCACRFVKMIGKHGFDEDE